MKKQKLSQVWYFWKDGCEEEKRLLDLPHDAMLEEERNPELETGAATGYYPGGKYVYVKSIFGDAGIKITTLSHEPAVIRVEIEAKTEAEEGT